MMNTYPLIEKAAFLIDHEVAAYIILSDSRKTGNLPEHIQQMSTEQLRQAIANQSLDEEYFDLNSAHDVIADDACFCSSFDGEATTCFPELAGNELSVQFDDDFLVYIAPSKEASKFEPVYSAKEELLAEYMAVFKKAEIELPDNFDWWTHVVNLTGTYFC